MGGGNAVTGRGGPLGRRLECVTNTRAKEVWLALALASVVALLAHVGLAPQRLCLAGAATGWLFDRCRARRGLTLRACNRLAACWHPVLPALEKWRPPTLPLRVRKGWQHAPWNEATHRERWPACFSR